jgi:protein SCO1/2
MLNGLFKALGKIPARLGKEYSVVAVSIDPSEKPGLAKEKKRNLLHAFGHSSETNGVHFLTGAQAAIDTLATAVGFRYVPDLEHKQFAHPAGVVVLTQEGKISRYLFGVEFPDPGLRLAIAEASQSKIGSPIESFLLYCYHYDPANGRYTLAVERVLSAAAFATGSGLFLGIFLMVRSEKRQRT